MPFIWRGSCSDWNILGAPNLQQLQIAVVLDWGTLREQLLLDDTCNLGVASRTVVNVIENVHDSIDLKWGDRNSLLKSRCTLVEKKLLEEVAGFYTEYRGRRLLKINKNIGRISSD